MPRLHEVGLDPLALGFACVATLLAALVVGAAAWRSASPAREPVPGVAAATSRIAGPRRHALRDGLVVAQVAMAVVLLAGASLLVRSYQRLQAVDPGFDPRGVLVAPVFLDMEQYGGDGKSRLYYATLLERLRGLPGVLAAGAATALPASPLGPDFERPVWPEGAAADERPPRGAWVRMVTTDYFRTLGMRIVSGRAFDERDAPDAPRSVILSEGLSRRLYPPGGAVGRRLVVDYSTTGTYAYEVVGVVADVRFSGPRAEARQEIYLPHAQRPYLVMNVALRSSADPRLLAPAVRQVLHELDPAKPAHGLYDLTELVGATYARDRYLMLVLSAFAAVAVLLALVGVHGVLSHRVRERTREIGIRIAVGASEAHLLRWITGQGLRLVLLGLLLGSALAAALARVVAGLLFGTSPLDPAALLAVACAAARRARRVAPPGVARGAHLRRRGAARRVTDTRTQRTAARGDTRAGREDQAACWPGWRPKRRAKKPWVRWTRPAPGRNMKGQAPATTAIPWSRQKATAVTLTAPRPAPRCIHTRPIPASRQSRTTRSVAEGGVISSAPLTFGCTSWSRRAHGDPVHRLELGVHRHDVVAPLAQRPEQRAAHVPRIAGDADERDPLLAQELLRDDRLGLHGECPPHPI